jgi:hypothetical protein
MTISQLIALVSNRLAMLNNSRSTAVALGHIDRLEVLDADIEETQETLNKLKAI